jgi:AcrR family transcriptional regulator
MVTRKPRGSYAKGTAKREEIIERAIDAFGRNGYHGTSMREIAAACKLSQAGLLHHFPNKESLLVAIVDKREREQMDSPEVANPTVETSLDRYLKQVTLNQKNVALTQLWANLVGEATDPEHPAHGYFKDRYNRSRARFADVMAKLNGRKKPNREDKLKAELFIALWDGLQNQWLIDEDFDMRPAFKYALEMFSKYSAEEDKTS